MWRVTVLFLVQFTLCLAIRVPVYWSDDSEVNSQQNVEIKNEHTQKPIYNEYFQYTAKKPQFAIEIAATHGVPSPEKHFKAHPIRPHTGLRKPELGEHRILNSEKIIYQPYQQFVQNTGSSYVTPVSMSFEIYHPYKAEQPALQAIYRDPLLAKIRNDVRDNKNRLQKHEVEAAQPDIKKEEYLESPEQIDRKKYPEKNVPAQFEIHRPQRRPVYYRVPSRSNHREQILNQKLRHTWNQPIKVTPAHYRPVKNHLNNLRQQHSLRYDDERNEYPQISSVENDVEQPDGYDIYEKGKDKYIQIRNNFENSINKLEQDKQPKAAQIQNTENVNSNHYNQNQNQNQNENENEFVPIQNYVQVRKTETTRHLPRTAAFDDADNLEEIQNAPRLREAIKSTKAQIVYSEEGYEDAAYDHAGEQKHASDHENHGGYLKEQEASKGKFKIPSISSDHKNVKGSAYRDQTIHGEKWKDEKKENQEEIESNDYSENEGEHSLYADAIIDINLNDDEASNSKKSNREPVQSDSHKSIHSPKKRKGKSKDLYKNNLHDVIKRESPFDTAGFNSTIPSEEEIVKLSKTKQKSKKSKINNKNKKIKYPYYFKKAQILNKNSPLRYAQNLALIPKKTSGGTEFYDSRSKLECPEVEDDVDPIPEKLKKEGHPDDNEENKENKEAEFQKFKDKQRLKGLGDKINCFKIKYFDENPLDNPLFKEETVGNPEPITIPQLKVFDSKLLENGDDIKRLDDIFSVLEEFNKNQNIFKKSKLFNKSAYVTVFPNDSISNTSQVNDNVEILSKNNNAQHSKTNISDKILDHSIGTQPIFTNKPNEDTTKFYPIYRKKRAAPFMYEPYKIIRDSQIQDSKKTTTSSNISPLIKQLQSSRVIDKVTTNSEKEQTVKRNAKIYKDIGKNDRQIIANDQSIDSSSPSFVDVNLDQRRGEPRYELRPANHKETDTTMDKNNNITGKDYKTQLENSSATDNKSKLTESTVRPRSKSPKLPKSTSRPYFDVSKYLPHTLETQSIAATNAVKKVIRATTLEPKLENNQKRTFQPHLEDDNDNDDDDDDEDDDEDDNKKYITTTTPNTSTSTARSVARKRSRGTTTVSPVEIEDESEAPKLRLTTRFRNSRPTGNIHTHQEIDKEPYGAEYKNDRDNKSPKYSEKKKKSTKSTLVTDTKTYGEDDDDIMTKKEVDDLIGVKHNMDEYTPRYENNNQNEKDEKKIDNNDNDDDDEEDDDEDEDEADEDEADEDDDDDDEDTDEDDDTDEDEDDDEDDDAHNAHYNKYKNKQNYYTEVTTSEPTKRTLTITTLPPATTTESRSGKLELKPVILKKKIEIHEELPINKASPHISQFKQDIKEIEVIKEVTPKPKKKKNKNIEALDLFKDENLAEEINKLGDVEIFRENMNLKSGPRHGGNYRSITAEELEIEATDSNTRKLKKDDAETSQSKTNPGFVLNNSNLSTEDDLKSAKYVELRDVEAIPKSMHGGNLRFSRNKGYRQNNKNEKYIELDENHDDENTNRHGDSSKSYGSRNTGRPMHGGNYRSARIVQSETTTEKPARSRGRSRPAKTNAADTLNNFDQDDASLTSPTPFILDPSKRMYYYVDA